MGPKRYLTSGAVVKIIVTNARSIRNILQSLSE
jgi:hypothetical protein